VENVKDKCISAFLGGVVGFEPTDSCSQESPVCKTGAINRSATLLRRPKLYQ
jgi:hypothetical protein